MKPTTRVIRQAVLRDKRGIPLRRPVLQPKVAAAIKAAVERDSLRFKVSRSFVINVILADHYGIDIERF